jgi:hypothetical protein
MSLVKPCGRELADLVAHHVFAYEYGYVSPAIVYADGVTHHVGGESAGARPTLDYALLIPLVHLEDFLLKIVVYVWPFFCRTCHFLSFGDFRVGGFAEAQAKAANPKSKTISRLFQQPAGLGGDHV